MSNEGEKKCPLCAEEMDWTDQQLKPCQCGYEVCVWCWHHIMEMAEKVESEGRCPACRTPYDKERIAGMEANCTRVVSTKKDQKSKPQKAKPKKPEVGKDLSGVRVIQRKMAYIIGLPLGLADENLLQRKEFFGQYGKVLKVSLSRTAGGAIQQFVNDTCSVYVTYSKEEEAIRCIQSIHGFILEGRFLRASFGTAKYCHAWLRNLSCTNAACLYLHSIGADEDSFSKDEEAAVHTRNRVHEIVGAAHNMQQRSGNMLPPPLNDPLKGNRVVPDKSIVGSVQKDTSHASLTSNGYISSHSSLDEDGRIKTPNKTFVDIVGGSSCGLEKDNSVTEDRDILNLCADFNSVGTECSDSMLKKVSSSFHLPRHKDSEEYFVKPFREASKFSMFEIDYFPSSDACIGNGHSFLLPGSCSEDFVCFDDRRSKDSDSLSQRSSVHSNIRAQQRKETDTFGDYSRDFRTVHNNHADEASTPFTCVNSAFVDGYNERSLENSTGFDSTLKPSSNLFSNEEIVEQLRRLDDNHISNEGDTSVFDVVESSIISNILSMDFDSCNDSSHSLADLLDGTGRRNGSLNNRSSGESRFSFAKNGNSVNLEPDLNSSFSSIGVASKRYSSLPDSMEKERHYLLRPQNHVSRAQSLIPPGFSAPSREPPPGFLPRERKNQVPSVTSGNHLVKTSSVTNGQYHVGSTANLTINHDFHFSDPAILVVGRGRSTNALNTPQDPKFPSTFMHDTPSAHQELRYRAQIANRFSPMGDNFGLSSIHMDPHHSYSPQAQQNYRNGHMSNGYGGDAMEIQGNERLRSNQFFSGYNGDLTLPSDVCNHQVYGL